MAMAKAAGVPVGWLAAGEGSPPLAGPRPVSDNAGSKGFGEGPPPPYGGLDTELLTDTLRTVERFLSDHAIDLDPEKKSAAVALVYEEYLSSKSNNKSVNSDKIGRLLRLVS